MNFTRDPIIESIITPKEGCKLVVRNSKGAGQEEYFVDSIEIVSFTNSLFYRSLERPKSFILPVTDYEVIEVRDTRVVLKHVGSLAKMTPKDGDKKNEASGKGSLESSSSNEQKVDKKRRRSRRRKEKEDSKDSDSSLPEKSKRSKTKPEHSKGKKSSKKVEKETAKQEPIEELQVPKRMLPPPSTLISETISRYKDNLHDQFMSSEQIVEDLEIDQQHDYPPAEKDALLAKQALNDIVSDDTTLDPHSLYSFNNEEQTHPEELDQEKNQQHPVATGDGDEP